jgi:hypothetical protein
MVNARYATRNFALHTVVGRTYQSREKKTMNWLFKTKLP